MSEKFTCPICGEPTRIYMGNARKDRLCGKHADELKAGKIEQCPDCSVWITTGETCKCKNATKQDASKELTCIICGTPSNGKHFCLKCYHKYKNRSVDIRITNCSTTEIMDDYGNLTIKCEDGRYVRSRAEALIYNWLFNKKIRTIYEETLYYEDENGESKTLHPDFYLPDYDLYIEYNELTNKPYLHKKEYAMKVYESLGKKVIIMSEKELNDIAACLKPILKIN